MLPREGLLPPTLYIRTPSIEYLQSLSLHDACLLLRDVDQQALRLLAPVYVPYVLALPPSPQQIQLLLYFDDLRNEPDLSKQIIALGAKILSTSEAYTPLWGHAIALLNGFSYPTPPDAVDWATETLLSSSDVSHVETALLVLESLDEQLPERDLQRLVHNREFWPVLDLCVHAPMLRPLWSEFHDDVYFIRAQGMVVRQDIEAQEWPFVVEKLVNAPIRDEYLWTSVIRSVAQARVVPATEHWFTLLNQAVLFDSVWVRVYALLALSSTMSIEPQHINRYWPIAETALAQPKGTDDHHPAAAELVLAHFKLVQTVCLSVDYRDRAITILKSLIESVSCSKQCMTACGAVLDELMRHYSAVKDEIKNALRSRFASRGFVDGLLYLLGPIKHDKDFAAEVVAKIVQTPSVPGEELTAYLKMADARTVLTVDFLKYVFSRYEDPSVDVKACLERLFKRQLRERDLREVSSYLFSVATSPPSDRVKTLMHDVTEHATGLVRLWESSSSITALLSSDSKDFTLIEKVFSVHHGSQATDMMNKYRVQLEPLLDYMSPKWVGDFVQVVQSVDPKKITNYECLCSAMQHNQRVKDTIVSSQAFMRDCAVQIAMGDPAVYGILRFAPISSIPLDSVLSSLDQILASERGVLFLNSFLFRQPTFDVAETVYRAVEPRLLDFVDNKVISPSIKVSFLRLLVEDEPLLRSAFPVALLMDDNAPSVLKSRHKKIYEETASAGRSAWKKMDRYVNDRLLKIADVLVSKHMYEELSGPVMAYPGLAPHILQTVGRSLLEDEQVPRKLVVALLNRAPSETLDVIRGLLELRHVREKFAQICESGNAKLRSLLLQKDFISTFIQHGMMSPLVPLVDPSLQVSEVPLEVLDLRLEAQSPRQQIASLDDIVRPHLERRQAAATESALESGVRDLLGIDNEVDEEDILREALGTHVRQLEQLMVHRVRLGSDLFSYGLNAPENVEMRIEFGDVEGNFGRGDPDDEDEDVEDDDDDEEGGDGDAQAAAEGEPDDEHEDEHDEDDEDEELDSDEDDGDGDDSDMREPSDLGQHSSDGNHPSTRNVDVDGDVPMPDLAAAPQITLADSQPIAASDAVDVEMIAQPTEQQTSPDLAHGAPEPMISDSSATPVSPIAAASAGVESVTVTGQAHDASQEEDAPMDEELMEWRARAMSYGIDYDFIEALPLDVLRDVVNEHERQERATSHRTSAETPAAPQAVTSSSVPESEASGSGSATAAGGTEVQSNAVAEAGLDEDFLAALPEDIRAEVLAQHAREQLRTVQPPADVSHAADMDPASFIATLTGDIRNEVLLTAGPEFLAQLPPHIQAEARMMREQVGTRMFGIREEEDEQDDDEQGEEQDEDDDFLRAFEGARFRRMGAPAPYLARTGRDRDAPAPIREQSVPPRVTKKQVYEITHMLRTPEPLSIDEMELLYTRLASYAELKETVVDALVQLMNPRAVRLLFMVLRASQSLAAIAPVDVLLENALSNTATELKIMLLRTASHCLKIKKEARSKEARTATVSLPSTSTDVDGLSGQPSEAASTSLPSSAAASDIGAAEESVIGGTSSVPTAAEEAPLIRTELAGPLLDMMVNHRKGDQFVQYSQQIVEELSSAVETILVHYLSDVAEDDSRLSRILKIASYLPHKEAILSRVESVPLVQDEALLEAYLSMYASHTALRPFLEKNRTFINSVLTKHPTHLNRSCYKALLQHPKVLDFSNKSAYFKSEMRKIIQSHRHHHLRLTVRRSHIFEDSFFAIRAHPPNDLKGPLNIRFEGEAGIDAGGLTREFFLSLSKEMFNPNYALFIQSFEHATFQPNPLSGINADHLDYFRFVGRVIAMALLHDQLLDAYFTRSFYKHILGVPIEIRDVESIDPEYYKSLQWMLDNPIEGVLDLNFTVEVEEFGLKKIVDLVENGSQIAVTDDNKKEYVRLVANAKMTSSIEKQIEAFNNGFREVIPIEKFSMFDEHELELLLNGMPEIDVDDLRKNTIYQGYGAGDTQVVWFWKVVQEMDKEDKARLVQFVTGTSKVPLGGFAELTGMSGPQKFSIHRVRGRGRALPTAHTCFNQLDLPEYESEEVLRDMLTLAIREGNQYFGAV